MWDVWLLIKRLSSIGQNCISLIVLECGGPQQLDKIYIGLAEKVILQK
jgi:hypothetical protein